MSASTAIPVTVRVATPDDAASLVAIYRPYVERTAITFEYMVPTAEDFRQRIAHVLESHPYLVAEDADGQAVGYAYAAMLKGREAYRWAAELSVYLAPAARGLGIGTMLYEAMTDLLRTQNVTNLYACITHAETEDEVHDNSSERFHRKLGFEKIAHFHRCGYKFQRWWDVVWMEKYIAAHELQQPPFIPFSELQNGK